MADTKKKKTSGRTPHTRGTGPEERGKAKIRAASTLERTPKRDPYYGEATVYGLKQEGGGLLAKSYEKTLRPSSKGAAKTGAKASIPKVEKPKSPRATAAENKKMKKGK